MAQDGIRESENEYLKKQPETEQTAEVEADGEQTAALSPAAAAAMLSGPLAPVQRRALVQNLGQHYSNSQIQRLLGTVRRSASSGPEGGPLEDDLSQKIQAERSSGQPLDPGVRSQVEQSVGHDLSPVRVHTGSTAGDLNRQLGAKAFTTGRDIFYGDGASPSDISLTTHEATHTVQQGFSEAAPNLVGAADTAQEHAAEHTAQSGSASGTGVQRQSAEEEEPVQMKRDPDAAIQRDEEEETNENENDDASSSSNSSSNANSNENSSNEAEDENS